MSEAKYPSKERVERDGVLVHAEGDDLLNDPDEAKRQGYQPDDGGPDLVTVNERVEVDGVLVAAEGDTVSAEEAERLGITTSAKPAKRAAKAGKKS